MFYDIYLDEKPASNTDTYGKLMHRLSELAQENAQYLVSDHYPIIICRYATKEERQFYTEFANQNSLKISFRPIKQTVFDEFEQELVRNEQLEVHLMDRISIAENIQNGFKTLNKKEKMQTDFEDASSNIQNVLRYRSAMLSAKFKPVVIYPTFLIWALFTLVLLCIHENWLLISCCSFILAMSCAIIGDYLSFRKSIKTYFSGTEQEKFWQTLASSNKVKNESIHAVANWVDSLQARNLLLVLPVGKRNVDFISTILDGIDTLSQKEILRKIRN